MVPTGEIAIDFNCSNVTGKGREFSKAGDAASLGFENKMREYAHLDYTPSTDTALGNLIGVCFDSCGGWTPMLADSSTLSFTVTSDGLVRTLGYG